MITSRQIAAFTLAGFTGLALASGQSEEPPVPTLERNPFARPTVAALQSAAAPRAANAAPAAALELRAVMVAGSASMVNVAGRIIGLGEEVDGHTLVEVSETTAVFTKDGQTVELTLDGIATDEEDDA